MDSASAPSEWKLQLQKRAIQILYTRRKRGTSNRNVEDPPQLTLLICHFLPYLIDNFGRERKSVTALHVSQMLLR